jgi:hypothetical protein
LANSRNNRHLCQGSPAATRKFSQPVYVHTVTRYDGRTVRLCVGICSFRGEECPPSVRGGRAFSGVQRTAGSLSPRSLPKDQPDTSSSRPRQ